MKDQIRFPGKKNYSIATGNYAFGFMPGSSVAMARATKKDLCIYGLEEAEVMTEIAHSQSGKSSLEGSEAIERYILACEAAGHLIKQVHVEKTAEINALISQFGALKPLLGEGTTPLLSSLMLAFDATTPAVKPRVVMVTEIRKKFVIIASSKSDTEAEQLAHEAWESGDIDLTDAPKTMFTEPYPMMFSEEEQTEIQKI